MTPESWLSMDSFILVKGSYQCQHSTNIVAFGGLKFIIERNHATQGHESQASHEKVTLAKRDSQWQNTLGKREEKGHEVKPENEQFREAWENVTGREGQESQ